MRERGSAERVAQNVVRIPDLGYGGEPTRRLQPIVRIVCSIGGVNFDIELIAARATLDEHERRLAPSTRR